MEPEILCTAEERLQPHHTALFIIDMQKDFCVEGFATANVGRPLRAAQSIIPTLGDLLEAGRKAGVLVCHIGLWTLPDHGSDSGPWLAQRRCATYATDCIALAGTEGAEFIEAFQPATDEIIIHKHRYSAFKGTNLDMILRAHCIETVVMTGVSTNVCVESTARDAFEYNYYVVVLRDCVASWSESLHEATLTNVAARFGLVTDAKAVMSIWRKK